MGGDREESKHKHKRRKKHSSSKKHSHKHHKSEHKHKSSRRHRHGKSHKKHQKHKDKKMIDEASLQNALENLEVLEDILKTSTEYSPEELMSQVLKQAEAGGSSGDDTDDSSSDSDVNLEEKPGSPAAQQQSSALPTEGGGTTCESIDQVGKGSSEVPLEIKAAASVESEMNLKNVEKSEESTKVAKSSTLSKEEVLPENKSVSEEAKKAETSKQPSSQVESKSDSCSDSEAESKKTATGARKDGSLFKPFSKKLKALGSKTEIKINIRQKGADASHTAGKAEANSVHKSGTNNKSNSSVKTKSESKSAREKRKDGESQQEKKFSRRSRTRSMTRSRSRSRTRHRRRRSRSHSRSPRRRRSRSRSRSPSTRSAGRRKSHYRSGKDRSRSRSHSHSRRHRSRSRSRSRSRRHRSRSRSCSHSRRHRSRSRSHSSSTSPERKKKKKSDTEKSNKPNTAEKEKVKTDEGNETVAVETTKNKKKQISQLTAFCKDLQEKQAHEDVYGETPTEVQDSEIHHPFAVKPVQPSYLQQPTLIYHNNAWKTSSQLAIEATVSDAAKPLVEKFPVSAGLQHTRDDDNSATVSDNVFAKYQEVSNLSMTDLVAKRLQAQRQILINPADVQAHMALNQVEQQASLWAESKVTPGQYTGQLKLTPLSKEAHNAGYQAWAKKKMFHGLAPVGYGFGMKMLKKMGWREGQPIGKQGEGHVEPICLDVKMDRSGLTTESDWKSKGGGGGGGGVQPASILRGTKAEAKTLSLVEGKHPVSALQELCARKKWDPPRYDLKEDTGPAHLKLFLYQVTIPLGTFQPAVGSNSKKQAKMQAATAALQGLGLIQKTIEYTSS